MSLLALRDALTATGIPTHHFTADSKQQQYIVWYERGEGQSEWADNSLGETVIYGYVSYVTSLEYDPNVDIIRCAMDENGISYKLVDIGYDEEAQRIEYQWRFEIAVGDSLYG